MPSSQFHLSDEFREEFIDLIRRFVPSNQVFPSSEIDLDEIRENYSPGDIFGSSQICEYISDNYSPDDVFGSESLSEWAVANGYRDIDGLDIEDIFPPRVIERWLKENGYIKEQNV